MIENEIKKTNVASASCSGYLNSSNLSNLNVIVSLTMGYNIMCTCNLTQVRVMLQVLLTTLFIIYFGQPSVERFLMKRVGGIAIHFD